MRKIVNVQTGEVTDDANYVAPDLSGPPVVPAQVTKLQLVRACRLTPWGQTDLWTAAKAALAGASAEMQEDWDLAVAIPRDDAGFIALATALGATSQDIDNVFILAGQQ